MVFKWDELPIYWQNRGLKPISLVPLQDTYIDMYIKVHYSYIAMYIKYI